jgi:hypothetical protein
MRGRPPAAGRVFVGLFCSIGDPDPVLQDPHVFGPPGFGSLCQRFGSGPGSFPFSRFRMCSFL